MTENGLDIQTISTKRTDFQTDRVLLLGQVTENKEKAQPEFIPTQSGHFLKFLLASRTNGTPARPAGGFGFARNTSQPFAKPKEPFFAPDGYRDTNE